MKFKLGESCFVKTIACKDEAEKSTETSGEEIQEEQEKQEENLTSVSFVHLYHQVYWKEKLSSLVQQALNWGDQLAQSFWNCKEVNFCEVVKADRSYIQILKQKQHEWL